NAAGIGAADRRGQAEGACRPPHGPDRGHPAEAQREGHRRRAAERARKDDLPPRKSRRGRAVPRPRAGVDDEVEDRSRLSQERDRVPLTSALPNSWPAGLPVLATNATAMTAEVELSACCGFTSGQILD